MEAMIAVAVLATIAVFVSQFNTNFKVANMGISRTCQAHAQSILNSIQEETYYQTTVNFIPTGGARNASSYGAPFDADTAAIRIATLPQRWWTGPPAAFTINTPDAVPNVNGVRLQNYQLIRGTMRTLGVIYNNTPAVQCQFGAYPPLTDPAGGVPWPNELSLPARATAITMRIQPYNRETTANVGAGPGCGLPAIYPAPTGGPVPPAVGGDNNNSAGNIFYSAFARAAANNSWAPPAGREGYKTGPGNAPPNPPHANSRMATRGLGSPTNSDTTSTSYGFEVSININYTQDGQVQNCSATQKFEYPVDRTPPPAPTIEMQAGFAGNPSYAIDGSRPTGPNPNGTVRIVISVPAGMEPGYQLLCRDLSWRKTWNPANPAPYNQPPCVRGGAIQANEIQYIDLPNQQDYSLRQNWWVPCDQVVQCARTPTATYSLANPNTNTGAQTLTLAYPFHTNFMENDGSKNCVFNMEVVAVDTAGNTHIQGVAANRVFLERAGPPAVQPIRRLLPNGNGGNDDGNTVDYGHQYLHAACGAFCQRNAALWTNQPAGWFPNGYWTTRAGGCCVNAAGSSSCRWNN